MQLLKTNTREVILARIDIPKLYAYFGVELEQSGKQYVAHCPFHYDAHRPNLSVSEEGLFHCFACGHSGSAIDFTAYALRREPDDEAYAMDAEPALSSADIARAFTFLEVFGAADSQQTLERKQVQRVQQPDVEMPPIPIEEVVGWQQNLWDNHPKVLQFLMEERGLDVQTINGNLLGYDDATDRITIPVIDIGGTIRNVRRYYPHPPKDIPKFIAYAKGYGRNRRLNPFSGEGSGPILLMAGEMDCLLAQSIGYDQADTFTAGEQTLPDETMITNWKGKEVYVWYDNDEPGRVGVRRVCDYLSRLVGLDCTPRVVAFPPKFPEGEDFTDLIVKHKYTKDDCDALLAQSVAWQPAPQEEKKPTNLPKLYAWTDLGNAERLVDQHGSQARWWSERRQWFTCEKKDGKWREHGSDTVRRWMQECTRAMSNEVLLYDEKQRDDFEKWRRYSENDGKTRGAMAQAQALLQVQPDDFDHDPWVLNVQNGLIDLKTGRLLPHSDDRLCLKQVPLCYNEQCDVAQGAKNWLAFLEHNLRGDQNFIDWVQKIVGYLLTGSTEEKLIFFVKGPRDTGKTKFIEVLMALLGEYAVQAPKSLVMTQRFQVHPENIAVLYGARLAAVSELDSSEHFNEGQLKWLSGGDALVARYMRENSFTFTPTHKLLLSANKFPQASGDAAVWRRLQILPFEVTIPQSQQNKRLFEEVLKPELPAILRWAVEGVLRWHEEGLTETPTIVADATEKYRDSMNPIADFLRERCIIEDGASSSRANIIGSYNAWCLNNGSKPITPRSLNDCLDEQFGAGVDQMNTAACVGMRLRTDYVRREQPCG